MGRLVKIIKFGIYLTKLYRMMILRQDDVFRQNELFRQNDIMTSLDGVNGFRHNDRMTCLDRMNGFRHNDGMTSLDGKRCLDRMT